MHKLVVIGAGPAGLSAAYELLEKSGRQGALALPREHYSGDWQVTVLDASPFIGGISRTIERNGNRFDIGPHRFFSKSDEVNALWDKLMPRQGAPAKDDILLNRRCTLAEVVDVEILQGLLRTLEECTVEIAPSRLPGPHKTHRDKSSGLNGYRVVEEVLEVEDAREPVAAKHHPVCFFRIWAACGKGTPAVEQDIVLCGGALTRHQFVPERIDFIRLGEETMRSNVEAVAVPFNRARNAADERRCLKNRNLPISRLLKKFIGGRKPRRPRSNDNQFVHFSAYFQITREKSGKVTCLATV